MNSRHLLGRTQNTSGSLFTPDFGKSPHVLVGRDEPLEALRDGLDNGPDDPRFTTIIMGHRGSGKTVLLNEIENDAASAGWIVLSTDAVTPGIHERISEAIQEHIDGAPETPPGLPDGRISQRETETRLGPSMLGWRRRLRTEMNGDWSVQRKLAHLGRHAESNDSAVLLTIDELQAGNRTELRRLNADLQHITKRGDLPVAFVGAGLPSIGYTLLRDPKMTFFQRCHDDTIDLLDLQSAMSFYKRTIADGGGDASAKAISALAQASAGHPFKMQVLGQHAWQIAGAPNSPIDMQSVELASVSAEERMRERVYRPLWTSLSERHKSILRVLVAHGGGMTRSEMGSAVSRSKSDISNLLRELHTSGCVEHAPNRSVHLGALMPFSFLNDVVEDENTYEVSREMERAAREDAPDTGAAVDENDDAG